MPESLEPIDRSETDTGPADTGEVAAAMKNRQITARLGSSKLSSTWEFRLTDGPISSERSTQTHRSAPGLANSSSHLRFKSPFSTV